MSTTSLKKRILIVEDDTLLRKALQEKFIREDFDVLEAEDGKKGLEVALREHPDLILLDIVMPVMDGWTMFERLRKENMWGKEVPVIMLTNLNSDDDKQIQHVAELEPAFFLVKANWKLDDVVVKVRERLSVE